MVEFIVVRVRYTSSGIACPILDFENAGVASNGKGCCMDEHLVKLCVSFIAKKTTNSKPRQVPQIGQ